MKSPFWLSVAYYPEQWPRNEWDRDFAAIQKAGFSAVRMFEFAWGRMEPDDNRFDFSMMDEAIALAAKYGLSVILCTPTAAPPPWLWSKYPDILPVGVSGLRYGASGRRHGCPSNEAFLRYSVRITRQMAQRYGKNPAVIAWQLDNEAGCHVNMRCYCESCQAKFRKWVEKKYGTVEALNEAWGLVFWSGEVNAFDQVCLHQNHLTLSNPAYELDVSRFQSDNWISFLQRQAEIIREYSEEQAIVHNEAWYAEQINGYDLGKVLDFVGVDSYPQEAALNTMTDEMYFSMKRKPFAIMEMGAGAVASAGKHGMVMAHEGKVAMVVRHMMNGAFLCSLFRYRPSPSGGEMDAPECGLVYHDATPMPSYYAFERHHPLLERLGQELLEYDAGARRISDVHERHKREYDAAIVLDYDDFFMIYSAPKGRNPNRYCRDILQTDYMQDMLLWHDALSKCGLSVTFVPPNENLAPYKVVVAHEKWTITRKFADKLTQYAKQGGIVVGADRFGTHVPEGRMSCVTLPGCATELFGVRYYDQLEATENPVTLELPNGKTLVSRKVIPLVAEADTQVLGIYRKGDLEGVPGMTCHSFGYGKAYYIGGLLEQDGVRLVARLVAQNIPKPPSVLRGDCDAIDVLCRGDIVAFINTTDEPQRLCTAEEMIDFMTGEPVGATEIGPFGFFVARRKAMRNDISE